MLAATVHALIGYVLLSGLHQDLTTGADRELKLFDVAVPAPPPPPSPPDRPEPRPEPEGAPAAAWPVVEASPVVAPPPAILLPLPPPVTAAPEPGAGAAPSAGAAGTGGPGQGAGGRGGGTGSGIAAEARLIRGRITDSDYPRSALAARVQGNVEIRFTIGADGRVSGCTVTRSSGSAELDSTTCRLIEKRFRYRPARDAQGRAVATTGFGLQRWWLDPRG